MSSSVHAQSALTEENIARLPNFTVFSLFPHYSISNFNSHKLSTIGVAEPLRLRHLPYLRSAQQGRTLLRLYFQQHTTLSQKNALSLKPQGGHCCVSQSCNSTSIFATYLPHIHKNTPYPHREGHCVVAQLRSFITLLTTTNSQSQTATGNVSLCLRSNRESPRSARVGVQT